MPEGLQHGALPKRSVHLCVDMQNLFRAGAPWAVPWFERVLPKIIELARSHPESTVFTRFIPPRRIADARGAWRRLYQRWPQVLGARAQPRWLKLAPELAALVPPARVVDRAAYSAFDGGRLRRLLHARRTAALIVSGTETDVCVLATVLQAVDLGLRVIVAGDAVCSSSDSTHDALMKLYRERFRTQIEIADTAEILAAWKSSR